MEGEEEAHQQKKPSKKEKKAKKREKRKSSEQSDGEVDTRKEEKKKKKKTKGKEKGKPTVSIAVAGSIIDNAQSLELATLLAGQIARAATIFRIDEVVVFDNKSTSSDNAEITGFENEDGNENGAQFLVKILRYLETPQYLRKRLFPMHKNLKYVGLLPPLDAPHHYRKHEWSQIREGVTLDGDRSNGTPVDVGLMKNILVEQILEPGKRVTVAMGTNRDLNPGVLRKVVPSSCPREEMGLYWGYRIRYAANLSSVFKNSCFKGGYDHVIGTSEHGQAISSSELVLPCFRHLLIVFGGLSGLEESIEEDNNLKGKGTSEVFMSYLNTCPHQGSRTIRTEEAILISLQYFQEPIKRAEAQKCSSD
ncbi:methyltransferase C9orf114 protein [Rhynchospora pubera]|uniref:Methyltransferase C9orf114 protein n=1 Tax=Rhynchospora pubera TaxID=906938 RepID=A0AAV8FQ04_9POAL|nr:methyltransferase C9orf114 protein [Rhynchospora pubera]